MGLVISSKWLTKLKIINIILTNILDFIFIGIKCETN